jgi:pyruvate/2-oxoacid:ferredoxin oxidoreductase alpha subunit
MKKLMKGNEAIAEAAIQAGCRFFFGYPITPQNQIPEYMSKRLPQVGGCFLQAESEVAAINMVYGAGGAGRARHDQLLQPGISLKQEGISYIVGAEVPASSSTWCAAARALAPSSPRRATITSPRAAAATATTACACWPPEACRKPST